MYSNFFFSKNYIFYETTVEQFGKKIEILNFEKGEWGARKEGEETKTAFLNFFRQFLKFYFTKF